MNADLILDRFEDLFPFYFQLNKEMILVSAGRSFNRVVDAGTFDFIRDVELIRPKLGVNKNFGDIQKMHNQVFILEVANAKGFKIKLKGQFITDQQTLMFCGSPWFVDNETLLASGLVINDFAIHDTVLDILHYIDLYRHSLDDLNMFNEKNKELRDFYESILEILPLEVAVLDHSQRYIFANSNAVPDKLIRDQLQNYTEAEAMRLLHRSEESIAARESIFKSVVSQHENAGIIEHLGSQSGNDKYLLRKYHPVAVQDYASRVISYAVDISPVKEAERKVSSAFQQMSEIVESIADVFISVDKNWKIIYWNSQAEETFGLLREDILGFDLRDKCSGFISQEYFTVWEKSMREEEVERLQGMLLESDRWHEMTSYPFMGGLSIYFRDITLQKRHEDEMQQLNMMLQEKTRKLELTNRDLEHYAYAASHDLQEPLRMVTGFLSKIEESYGDDLNPRVKRYIEFATDGATRMRRIILDLLEYSRVGSDTSPAEAVRVSDLLENVFVLLNAKINETSASITCGDMPVVMSHPSLLQTVFLNLIANALKYARDGVSPVITISCERMADHFWKFCIADNGIGIPEKYFDKIFVIFQRLHNNREYTGTGIGLSVTKKIVVDLGGDIWVESKEGEGSKFYFTIPS